MESGTGQQALRVRFVVFLKLLWLSPLRFCVPLLLVPFFLALRNASAKGRPHGNEVTHMPIIDSAARPVKIRGRMDKEQGRETTP